MCTSLSLGSRPNRAEDLAVLRLACARPACSILPVSHPFQSPSGLLFAPAEPPAPRQSRPARALSLSFSFRAQPGRLCAPRSATPTRSMRISYVSGPTESGVRGLFYLFTVRTSPNRRRALCTEATPRIRQEHESPYPGNKYRSTTVGQEWEALVVLSVRGKIEAHKTSVC